MSAISQADGSTMGSKILKNRAGCRVVEVGLGPFADQLIGLFSASLCPLRNATLPTGLVNGEVRPDPRHSHPIYSETCCKTEYFPPQLQEISLSQVWRRPLLPNILDRLAVCDHLHGIWARKAQTHQKREYFSTPTLRHHKWHMARALSPDTRRRWSLPPQPNAPE